MFKKEKETSINPNETDTIIGESSRIEGNIITKASLRIEGQVEGDIETEGDVTIGKQGEAWSHIKARNVLNAGTIRGSVNTKGELTITESGKLYGDIHVASLSIANGGQFHGTSVMDEVDAATDQMKTNSANAENTSDARAEDRNDQTGKRGRPHLHKVEGKNADENKKKSANDQKKAAAR